MKTKRKILLLIIDCGIIASSFFITSLLLNYPVFKTILPQTFISIFLILALYIIFSAIFQIYNSIWRYAENFDFIKLAITIMFSSITFMSFDYLYIHNPEFLTLNVYSSISSTLALIMARIMYIMFMRYLNRKNDNTCSKKRALLIGAGYTSKLILTELLMGKSAYKPVCLVDDDVTKIGRTMDNISITGCTEDIPKICKVCDIKTIIFAIPSCDEFNKQRILNLCMRTDCEVKIIPYISNIIESAELLSKMCDVKIEDLLGREPVTLECEAMKKYIEDKVCMVTGGGGSIGSELCRQIANLNPKKLIILDVYENNAYDIQQELKRTHKQLCFEVEIACVTDKKKIEEVLKKHNIDIIFHAAAHKHVPLMETNPEEAVKNNIRGTMNVALLADQYKVKKFIMISTDKAVNPTNVMGATKRICEMIVSVAAKSAKYTEYASVRFGNVLGSNGSVIPLFREQIKAGGPVTVTHPDIIRYFMIIPEAVSLVLNAGALAKGGEIFVLDMGKPVRIVDLAENLIRLSGFSPYKDIKIEFTGLRPGEKLYEELLLSEEDLKNTENSKIFIGSQIEIDPERFRQQLDLLLQRADSNDKEGVIASLKNILPNFHHNLNNNGLNSNNNKKQD